MAAHATERPEVLAQESGRQKATLDFEAWRATIPDLEKRQYERIKDIGHKILRNSRLLVAVIVLQFVILGILYWLILQVRDLRRRRPDQAPPATAPLPSSPPPMAAATDPLPALSPRWKSKRAGFALAFAGDALSGARIGAIILFNIVLLFAAVNGVFALILPKSNTYEAQISTPQEQWKDVYTIEMLRTVYPGLSDEDILRKTQQVRATGVTYEPFIQNKTEAGLLGAATAAGMHEEGFRLIGREQGPWPPDAAALNIFVFGGSTGLGVGMPDDQTIPAYLQNILRAENKGRRINVYNFGAPGYFSQSERVFLERMILRGAIPDIAVFIDGYNDFHLWQGEPGMTWSLRLQLVDWLLEKNQYDAAWYWSKALEQLPIVLWLKSLRPKPTLANFGTNFVGGGTEDYLSDPAKIETIIARYARNKRMVEGIAKAYGFKTLFVWQPTSTYKHDGELPMGKMGGDGLRTKWGYPAMRAYAEKNGMGDNFHWCGDVQDGIREAPYVDGGIHYNRAGGRLVAQCVAEGLTRAKLVPGARPARN